MVNHFASLLCNLNLSYLDIERDEYLLAGDSPDSPDFFLVTQGGYYIYLDGSVAQEASKSYSVLTNRNYNPIELPPELGNFHSLLFSEKGSKYYQQFLLYCYLRVVAATNLKDHVKTFDNRITYNLEEFSEYFRSPRLSPTTTNDINFKLLVSGGMDTSEGTESFSNHIAISQLQNTSKVAIYSITQREYYRPGEFSSKTLTGMEVNLSEFIDPARPQVTKPIALSDTGLTISITGPFDRFTDTPGKVWTFSTEAPFVFDFSSKLALIKNSDSKVDEMLNYAKDITNPVFENIWRSHHNSVYSLAGLLVAYVERMNLIWETRRT